MSSPSSPPVSTEKLEAAHTALETLEVWRKHRLGCKQCRYDPSFCTTSMNYQVGFEKDMEAWRKAR